MVNFVYAAVLLILALISYRSFLWLLLITTFTYSVLEFAFFVGSDGNYPGQYSVGCNY